MQTLEGLCPDPWPGPPSLPFPQSVSGYSCLVRAGERPVAQASSPPLPAARRTRQSQLRPRRCQWAQVATSWPPELPLLHGRGREGSRHSCALRPKYSVCSQPPEPARKCPLGAKHRVLGRGRACRPPPAHRKPRVDGLCSPSSSPPGYLPQQTQGAPPTAAAPRSPAGPECEKTEAGSVLKTPPHRGIFTFCLKVKATPRSSCTGCSLRVPPPLWSPNPPL